MPGNDRLYALLARGRGFWTVRSCISSVLLLSLLVGTGGLVNAQEGFVSPAVAAIWERTERPVIDGRVSRSFLWGPGPIGTRTERYDEAGRERRRTVQYFDKGRLELPEPAARDLAQLQGSSLVRDLALGLVIVGSNRVQVFDPAFIPVVGDNDEAANPEAPRYVDFVTEVLLSTILRATPLPRYANAVGKPITATIQAGRRDKLPANASVEALVGAYDLSSGHNIAAPFWEAFGASGLVVDPASGASQTAPLYDWRVLVGAPLSEPSWSRVAINGRPTWVLIQLFERRVMTYRPDAPEGWRVEMANTGQHYLRWRYGPAPTRPPLKPVAPLQPGRSGLTVSRTPITPTTPYEVVSWVPESRNATITPGVGPGGTRHAVLVKDLRAKDLIRDSISIWLTREDGRVLNLNGPRAGLLFSFGEERLDGLLLVLDTSVLEPGVWAVTMQFYDDPDRTAVIYVRVTAEPRELALNQLLDPSTFAAMADVWLPASVIAAQEGQES